MSGNFTELVAWYGAVVATLVFIFDVWKWSRHQAKLRAVIREGIAYPDGGFSKVEKTENGEVKAAIIYYHIEITNTGELPTTILGIAATTKAVSVPQKLARLRSKFKGVLSYSSDAFKPHYGKTFPHVIGPGEVWSGRIPADTINSLYQAGYPNLELTVACSRLPIYVVFPDKRLK